MKFPRYASATFLIVFFVALFLRRKELIGDPLGLALVALSVVGFATCTIWVIMFSIKQSKDRRELRQ